MEQLNTAQLTKEFKCIDSISKLKLTTFIECCTTKDISSLVIEGEIKGNEDELNKAWTIIISQYNEARKDEKSKEHNELRWKIKSLELRFAVIVLLITSLNGFYSKVLIDSIKKFDEEFCQFEFSEESIENDLIFIKNIEINSKIEYESLCAQLVDFEISVGIRGKDGKVIEEPNDSEYSIKKEKFFYDYVMSYNEIFKTSHSVNDLSTMEYAIMCARHDKYIEDTKNKNSK